MFCAHCGNAVADIAQSEEHVAETEIAASADVQIARINADRDIQLAKIAQRMNDSDNQADLVAAEVAAEVQSDVIDQLTPDPEPAPEPVVIVNNDDAEPAEDPTELPVAEEHSEPAESKTRVGLGVW